MEGSPICYARSKRPSVRTKGRARVKGSAKVTPTVVGIAAPVDFITSNIETGARSVIPASPTPGRITWEMEEEEEVEEEEGERRK